MPPSCRSSALARLVCVWPWQHRSSLSRAMPPPFPFSLYFSLAHSPRLLPAADPQAAAMDACLRVEVEEKGEQSSDNVRCCLSTMCRITSASAHSSASMRRLLRANCGCCVGGPFFPIACTPQMRNSCELQVCTFRFRTQFKNCDVLST